MQKIRFAKILHTFHRFGCRKNNERGQTNVDGAKRAIISAFATTAFFLAIILHSIFFDWKECGVSCIHHRTNLLPRKLSRTLMRKPLLRVSTYTVTKFAYRGTKLNISYSVPDTFDYTCSDNTAFILRILTTYRRILKKKEEEVKTTTSATKKVISFREQK